MAKTRPQWLGTDDRFARLRRIETLDPQVDYREITELFYTDFRSIMVLQGVTGNLMTFAAPRMSRILSSTGQFEHHTAKRFVDTSLLVSAVMKSGLGPGEGRDAAKRVNAMHSAYDIHPDDFVAVGCDVLLMSIEVAERFGWRPVSDAEREALRIHYSLEARAFGSHKPLPDTLEAMHFFWDGYLDTQLAFEPQNKVLATAFMGFLPSLVPAPLRGIIAPLLEAQVDPRVLTACGLKLPSKIRRRISTAFMKTLAKSDPRPDPAPGTKVKPMALITKMYPNGYSIDALGTHLAKKRGSAEGVHQ